MVDLPWLVLDIEHAADDSPWVESVLEEFGFEGWEIPRELPDVLWRLYVPLEGEHETRLKALESALQAAGARCSRHGEIRDEDWAENWKQFYHPFAVGERLVVAPTWEDPPEAMAQGRQILRIDPGSAFGTGYHESTRLCLLGLEALAQEDGWGESCLLDYGTGSGILALAALLLGCPRVVASDRDPVAVRVARENLQASGFPPTQYRLEQSDLPQAPHPEDGAPDGRYPLVVANLTADILCLLAQPLIAVSQRHVLLGGIVEKRAPRVLETFEAAGCRLVQRRQENDWVSFQLLVSR